MSAVELLGAGGDKVGSVDLPADIFDVTTNIPLVHQVVTAQLAAARQGTHATKTRGLVRGGGIKPWRQKGTGRARQGSRRAPQWVGGGIVHGPQPRSYAQKTPKRMIQAALFGTLSDRARDGRIFVLDTIVAGEVPSTKKAVAALKFAEQYRNIMVVLDRDDVTSWLSVRNLVNVHAVAADQFNAYDVVVADAVIFTRPALEAFAGAKGAAITVTEAKAVPAKKAAPKAEADEAGKPESESEAAAAHQPAKKPAAKKSAAAPVEEDTK